MLHPHVAGVEAAGAYADFGAARVGRSLGDNVDDAGESVRAVERRTGAANDFDAGDMLDRIAGPHIALVADKRGGHRNPVLQHQYLRHVRAVDAAHKIQGRVLIGRAPDVDAGDRFEDLVKVGRAHCRDVLGGDNGRDRGGAAQRLLAAGGDADVAFVAIHECQFFFLTDLCHGPVCLKYKNERQTKRQRARTSHKYSP